MNKKTWTIILIIAALAAATGIILATSAPQKDTEPAPISEAKPLPDPTQAGYELITREMSADDLDGDLVLVNNTVAWPFPENSGLVSIFSCKSYHYGVRDTIVSVQERVMEPLNALLDAFYENTGNADVLVCAGWRSIEEQQALYDESVASDGAEHAAKYVALPGGSEHHTGLAVDFSIYHADTGVTDKYDGLGEYSFITDNAWRYGFVRRYESGKEDATGIAYEPWHYRYVGLPHSALMTEYNMCLEEYLDALTAYTPQKPLAASFDGVDYEIYYCEGQSVPVPADAEYSISATNTGGYVVTVTLS